MSIAKIIEVTSDSEEGFDDAVRSGIATVAESVRNVRSAWVQDQQVMVEDDEVQTYRVTMKVTFVVDDEDEEDEEADADKG